LRIVDFLSLGPLAVRRNSLENAESCEPQAICDGAIHNPQSTIATRRGQNGGVSTMNLARTLLRPVAWLAGRHAGRQAAAFLAAHRRTAQVQQRLLGELLAAHAETAFGREHGFAGLRTYEDFAAAVPVRDYQAHRPWLQRVVAGESAALLPAGSEVLMFAQTSGTTGQPKHIPVTRRFLAEMRRGWNIFGLRVLGDHREAWLRPILTISSSMRESLSPTGVPCGAMSGLLAATQKRIVRRMYVAPRAAGDIRDPRAKYYTILRWAVGRDVAVITTANPSSTIKLIETGQAHAERLVRDIFDGTCRPPGDGGPAGSGDARGLKPHPNVTFARRLEEGIRRDGELLPRHFWNVAVLCNWTGGTLGLYLPRLRELFGDVPLRDIGLLASEGRFSVPLADGTPAGVAEITGNFLEFIPAGQYGSPAPRVLRAHELDIGGEYFLVVSNWAGLWRYSIDDRVRVTGRLGQSPLFEFLSRGLHTASITGEKLTEWQVVEAMRLAAAELAVRVERFTLQGVFAHVPYYRLTIEPFAAELAPRVESLAGALDRRLGELNIEYAAKRAGGRLGPLRAVAAAAGHFEAVEREAIRLRLGRGEQYKHKYLLTEVETNG